MGFLGFFCKNPIKQITKVEQVEQCEVEERIRCAISPLRKWTALVVVIDQAKTFEPKGEGRVHDGPLKDARIVVTSKKKEIFYLRVVKNCSGVG